ncbi:flagellar motor switch protein FliN [Achromobacter sp. 413638]|jgi:flagellar motor switch protein FliN/FliY|uniref:flagellar motor switch protein FliN n=1 Tax=Achromobacter sp. 413638 TaxID=3342385 RepID=UPI00324F7088
MTDKNEPGTGSSPADDWADALAEQSRANPPTQADGLKPQEPQDDWAAAMAEQTAAAPAAAAAPAPAPAPAPAQPAAQPAAQSVFKPLSGTTTGAGTDIDLIMDVPVQLTVELGRTRLTIKNLLQLGQGSVVELDGLAGEPMDIFVNGYLIAQGEVVVVEDKYGIRLTDIITPSERINRLNNRR